MDFAGPAADSTQPMPKEEEDCSMPQTAGAAAEHLSMAWQNKQHQHFHHTALFRAVSYTHLDVYKRQVVYFEQHSEPNVILRNFLFVCMLCFRVLFIGLTVSARNILALFNVCAVLNANSVSRVWLLK